MIFCRFIRHYLKSALTLLVLGTPLLALAHEYQSGNLHIGHPSSRATPPGASNGVAYLTVHNGGEEADRLLSANTPRAERVQLHKNVEENGMTTMKHIELPLAIEPGNELKLHPGGYHFMLMGLSTPLKADERVPLTLTFEEAGTVEVELAVEGLDREAGPSAEKHHHGGH